MRCGRIVCAFFTASFLLGGGAAWGKARVWRFTVGSEEKMTVWAIEVSAGGGDASAFAGTDPDTLKRYLPLGPGPSGLMAFLVRTGIETVLIDAGPEPSRAMSSRLLDGLSRIGVAPKDVTMVLLTHMHSDHIGGLIRRNRQRTFPLALVLSSRPERDFWLQGSGRSWDRWDVFYTTSRILKAYTGRILGLEVSAEEPFEFGTVVTPGIRALDAHGHTPGHTAFLLECGGEKLLFWGDLVHNAELQFPRPDISSRYDMDPALAAEARLRLMEQAAGEKLLVAGSRLPFPGVGTVEKIAPGSYLYHTR